MSTPPRLFFSSVSPLASWARPNSGGPLSLSAIAAAVIGGTSLMGGHGSMLATFVGVLIIAALEAGLAHPGAEAIRARLAARRIRRVTA